MSTERELIVKYQEAMETRDLNGVYPYLADDMTFEILPSSVGQKVDKAGWMDLTTTLFTLVQSSEMDHTHVAGHPGFVAVQTTITLTFPFGPFTEEVLVLFTFSKDKSGALKIASITEYVDSLKVKELREKVENYPK